MDAAEAAQRLAGTATPLTAGPHRLGPRSTLHRAGPAAERSIAPQFGITLTAAELQGRVLADDILPDARGPLFVPFAPGCVRVPYTGERPRGVNAAT